MAAATVYIKIIGEAILALVILMAAMGDNGIVSNTMVYNSQIEPIILQHFMSTTLMIGSLAPGDFGASYNTMGSPHFVTIFDEDGVKYVKIKPVNDLGLKVKFKTIGKTPLGLSGCSLDDMNQQLRMDSASEVVVQKSSGDECKLNIIIR